MRAIELKDNLVSILASCEKISGIGQTGNMDTILIPGKSDIDLFVLCSEVPTKEERQEFYSRIKIEINSLQMEVCNGGLWGYGDILVIDGIDVMPMYFTIEEMQGYIEEVLKCKHMGKEGRFYPVGRLASISDIHILYEKKEAWSKLKNMVNQKPESFFQTWFHNEISQVIDEEDLGRCELRKEVLFFHQVLEEALDHLLQALYAVNLCYFPSRKRTMAAIEKFQDKPERCYERIINIVQNGVKEDRIQEAIEELRIISNEIIKIGENKFQ